MTEQNAKPKVLMTELKALQKIKAMQFRRQMLPMAIVVLLLIINIVSPHRMILYPALAAFAWYLLERIRFRTKNKIAAPDAGTFVSPVNGKIQSVRKNPDSTQITMRKSWLDVVELRLPYPDLKMESNRNWIFDTAAGKVAVSIESGSLTFFENTNTTGSVIGVIPSSAIVTINVPVNLKVLVQEKQNVFGGETVLFELGENFSEQPEPRSILAEEPIQDLN